jgi:ribosomal protein L37E
MGVSVWGTTHPHLHHPCQRCGYATRFKQWPTPCLCTHGQPMKNVHVEEIWAEQEQKNAALRTRVPTNVPPLRIADRYAAGRPRPR